MILIDFAPGLHGHFLEFVINRYLFNVEYSIDTIFQTTGAAHLINVDPVYQKNKIVESQHYSSLSNQQRYNTQYKKIIFIKHDWKLDFVVQTNIFYRCYPDALKNKDFPAEEIIAYHLLRMGYGSDLKLRNNWFAKLHERHFDAFTKQAHSNVPVFEFDFGNFFDLTKFLLELQKTAVYLEMTFKFDHSLVDLWNEFIEKNQGYRLHSLGNNLLSSAYNNLNVEIPNDWKLHAYMNYVISETFRLYDGELFESAIYPTNTQQIHKIIIDHIDSFDTRFP
tara:strand:+ start:16 stop:852 length:837 start_codon:yes stop_codon:yes gene_type:complete